MFEFLIWKLINMSLYGQYLKEREGVDILETEYGFVTFKVFPAARSCFIADIFIKDEARGKGLGTSLMQQVQMIAKKSGCLSLITTVDPLFDDAERSRNLFRSLGMTPSGMMTVKLETFSKDID